MKKLLILLTLISFESLADERLDCLSEKYKVLIDRSISFQNDLLVELKQQFPKVNRKSLSTFNEYNVLNLRIRKLRFELYVSKFPEKLELEKTIPQWAHRESQCDLDGKCTDFVQNHYSDADEIQSLFNREKVVSTNYRSLSRDSEFKLVGKYIYAGEFENSKLVAAQEWITEEFEKTANDYTCGS
jgi:hypothetical protein